MKTVGSYEAKTRLPSLLADVEKNGEKITITKHGRPVAMLVPVQNRSREQIKAAVERMREFGKGRSLGGLRIRDLIEEGRRF